MHVVWQQTPKGFSEEATPTLQVPSPSGGGQPHVIAFNVMPESGQGADLVVKETDLAMSLGGEAGAKLIERGTRIAQQVDGEEQASTLRGFGHGWQGQHNDTNAVVYRKAQKAHDDQDCERWEADSRVDTLDASGLGARTATAVVEGGHGVTTPGVAGSVQSAGGKPGQGYQAVAATSGVRRLTPLECERLQGFPDTWTEVPGASDSTRYRQLGNAVAVPVVEWIARRMVAVEERLRPTP